MHRSSKSPGGTRARHMASPAGAPRRQCNAASGRCRPGAGSPGPFHGRASAWIGRAHPCLAVLWMDAWSARVCVCVCVCVWWCGDVFFSLLKEREGKRCKGDGQKGGGEKKRREGEGGAGRRPGHGVGHGCCTDPNREPTKTRDECRVIGRQRRICRASSLRRFTGRANSRAKLFRVSLGSSGPEAAKIPTWRSTHARQARSLLKLGAHRPL